MTPAVDGLWEKCRRIPSPDEGISFSNVRDLHRISSSLKNGTIVEIGSWLGRGTLALAASAAANGNRIHAIDPWLGTFSDELECVSRLNLFGRWRAHMEANGVDGVITPHRGAASWVRRRWNGGGIDFLFIDGMHNYHDSAFTLQNADIEKYQITGWLVKGAFCPARGPMRMELPPFGVKADYDLWAPLVKWGGYIGFHDVNAWPDVTRVWEEEIAGRPDRWEIVSLEKMLGIARRRK